MDDFARFLWPSFFSKPCLCLNSSLLLGNENFLNRPLKSCGEGRGEGDEDEEGEEEENDSDKGSDAGLNVDISEGQKKMKERRPAPKTPLLLPLSSQRWGCL